MAPKRKGKAKQRKAQKALKTSATKLSNKRLNRLAKQGKLKDKRKRKSQLLKRLKKSEPEDRRPVARGHHVHEELPLEDDDIEYYSTPGKNTSFVSSAGESFLRESDEPRNKKRKKDTQSEEDYERLPRKLFPGENNKKMKMMLPIKTKSGVVPQVLEESDQEQSDEEEGVKTTNGEVDQTESQSQFEPLPALSSIELFALRKQKLEDRKKKMALLSSGIIENPQEATRKLKDLVGMLEETDSDVCITVRKLVMVSLMEVFKDIIPGYKIRVPSEKERQQQMKKDTKSLLESELSLLKSYKTYLEFLEKALKGEKVHDKKTRKRNIGGKVNLPEKAKESLQELSMKCLCAMLVNHPHFNLCNNIITVIVPYMNRTSAQISDIACDAVKRVFREDKSGEVSLELVRCINRMIKTREFAVQPKVLETFLALRIKEVNYSGETTGDNSLSGKLSRRDKKRKKKIVLLERELLETKATEDKTKKVKLHTEIIQSIFLTYFRILKQARKSALLPAVLEGLAKFAHLISVDFFDDLFKVFNELIESEELSYRESLHCVQTAFTILSGQGAVINIDPVRFYTHLYRNLFHVHAGCTCDDVPIILNSLDLMVNKRKRQMSQHRVLAFVKRLSTLALQQLPSGAASLLAVLRNCIMTYRYTDILFDNESQGSGVFLPELEDPEHCNAHNTMLWELSYLRHHYHPVVRKYSHHICKEAPSTGEGQLAADLARKSPVVLFEELNKVQESIFDDAIPKHPAKKCQRKFVNKGLLQEEMESRVTSVLTAVPDKFETDAQYSNENT